MTDLDKTLLERLKRLQEAHKAAVPPAPPHHGVGKERYRAGAQRWDWRTQAEHGPRVAALYGNGYDDAARKRVARALDRLAGAGLVELWGEGRNATHCRLTPAGENLAQESLGEESRR